MSYYSDEEDEEGMIHSPQHYQSSENLTNPNSLDYKTWKTKAGKLIKAENHVLMHTDVELRDAISEAIFLESASQNLINKRKRQIEILDEERGKEGVAGKKLFDEIKHQMKAVPHFAAAEPYLMSCFARSSLPLTTPDVRRPPPSMLPLPPMHIPPPSFRPATPSSSTTSVTSAMANTMISQPPPPIPPKAPKPLMSEHLLPPPLVLKNSSIMRFDEKNEKKSESTTESHEIPGDSTSWRRPFHPIPLPPPPFSPFEKCVHPIPPFVRNKPPSRFGTIDKRSPSSSQRWTQRAISPPGIVGINVRGLFTGRRSSDEFRRRPTTPTTPRAE